MASGGSGPAGSLPSSSGCPPPSGTRSRSRPAIVSAGSGTDSKANVEAFTQAVKKWEEQKANTSLSAFDPTELLNDMADLLEKETDTYLSKDPDPFMDRHPSRIDPDCPFGQLLKAFFRKEALVEEVFNDYTRDNYWSRLGQNKNSFDLNVAACRVILDIVPGLQKEVLDSTDGLIKRLLAWSRSSPEPLQSYATGLLGVALELSEVATDPEIREINNTALLPAIIARLRSFKAEAEEEKKSRQDAFKRPFGMFGKVANGEAAAVSAAIPPASPPAAARRLSEDEPLRGIRSPERGTLNPGWPSSRFGGNGEWSNSSWAEMESQLIGHFPIHPLTLSAKQVFIFRYLTPLGEYQEFLAHVFENKLIELILYYVDLKETNDARLTFEALRFCSSLFVHRKFTMDWVAHNGVQAFLKVPRPSIAATAVAQCIYYMAHDEDAMEKVCLLPQEILTRLIKYALWLVECSHDSGRQWGVMFCGLITPFKVLLDVLDQLDGVRIIFNSINTLHILNMNDGDMENTLTDDQEYNQRLFIRFAMVTLKMYFHAHLGIKAQQMRRVYQREIESGGRGIGSGPANFMAGSPSLTYADTPGINGSVQKPARSLAHLQPLPSISGSKAARYTPQQVCDNVETLFELMPFRGRWPALDNFIQLGGVATCLKTIANAYDWTFQGRAEMVRSALEILSIAAISPKVQLQFCEKVNLPDDTKPVGINILLGAAEGEIVQDSADVQRAALQAVINCVCAPIERKGSGGLGGSLPNSGTPGRSAQKPRTGKTSEEIINKLWDCVRQNNGIMVLLEFLHIKTPITDADSIRALACRALVGLARSENAKQIMSKLPIFANNQLQQLVREPVLQDKRTEHLKFQQHAYALTELVLGPSCSKFTAQSEDLSLAMLHRASVVAKTKIKFSKDQLLQLIHQYLSNQGLKDTAAKLVKEASLTPLTRKLSKEKTSEQPTLKMKKLNTPSLSNGSITDSPDNWQTPIKIRKRDHSQVNTPTSSQQSNYMTLSPQRGPKVFKEEVRMEAEGSRITLESIVSDYLSGQHSLCKNPMVTCPEFDLQVPHKCPDPKPKNAVPSNFVTRLSARMTNLPYHGGQQLARLDRKLLYSRFRPVKTFRAQNPDDVQTGSSSFTAVAMMPDNESLLVGTYMGTLKLFDIQSLTETSSYGCHDSQITRLEPNRSGSLLLTSSQWRAPYSCLWSMGDFFDSKIQFRDEDYVEFSKLNQDKVIGTDNRNKEKATVWDIETAKIIREFKPQTSNNYLKNQATFDHNDELVLNDGVLYDMRTAGEVRKLDKLNQNLNGVFHPNGLEIVSSSEVWDIRTFHLLRTVKGLDNCHVTFTHSGDVMYAVGLERDNLDSDSEDYDSAFKTFDAVDYSNIATIETKRAVLGLSPSLNDLQLAVVESAPTTMALDESVVRLYDVGRHRAEEEDLEDGDEDDDDENEAEEDDLIGLDDESDDDDDDDDFDDDDDDDDDEIEVIQAEDSDEADSGDEDEDAGDAAAQNSSNADENPMEVDGASNNDSTEVVVEDGSNSSWEDIEETE